MTAPDPRLGEIEARAERRKWALRNIADVDRDYLLAELRKRDEALGRVEALAERWAGLDNSPGASSARLRTLRAAVAAATGGGE